VPAVLDEICADVRVIEELERKIYTPYSKTASYEQFLEYRSEGATRIEKYGSRHYRTPYGDLPSVTTILSATSGNKAALERWAKKNPGGREAAAARGTRLHSLMEEYLLGINKNPVIEDQEIAEFWNGLSNNLDKLGRVIWAENPVGDAFPWCVGSDGVSRVWHPGVQENETWGFVGAPDIVAEYKGKIVLGDLKSSNGRYYAKHPGPDCPKSEYGMRRAGFWKYTKCMLQLGAYSMGLEHTCGIVPDLFMIFCQTREHSQVFAVQGGTIKKYQEKWLQTVEKYYTEVLPKLKEEHTTEIDFEAVDADKEDAN
jgi:hypothetical protein